MICLNNKDIMKGNNEYIQTLNPASYQGIPLIRADIFQGLPLCFKKLFKAET